MKRIIALYSGLVLCLMALMIRLIYIGRMDFSSVMESQSKRTVVVGQRRGMIYDRNLTPLVNRTQRLVAAVTPSAAAYEYLKGKAEDSVLIEKIEKGYPFLMEVDEEINNEFIRTFTVSDRYDDDPIAEHIIGYTDSSGENGVTGMESSCDIFLRENAGKLSVTFAVDAVGRVLAGMKKTVNDENYSSKAGVVLTLDESIQRICEKAMEKSVIKSGCALVMHAHTGEILASVSLPRYDPGNVAASLDREDSPLVNKVLEAYAPGSVFKPLVAAAALESGVSPDYEYECTGSVQIGDRVFSCYGHKSHGKMNMTTALEQSCNTYFVNLIMHTDSDFLLELCRRMGLGEKDVLASRIAGRKGTLPDENDLKIKGELANFAFGQGKLMLTPLQVAKIYHTLATGNCLSPRLIMGYTDYMGLMTKEKSSEGRKLLSGETVTQMRKMLSSVTENGNARSAYSDLVKLAGKTGTAQSGIFSGSEEICRTWFAGFFPANNPHYIVVVLNENGMGGSSDCAPVFREICLGIVTEKEENPIP
ncbi:MAG: penicillin-binding protein 2 [Oscillospiraceae bacterium]|nr:penicillin-binding protein 2 [Oscillospiraceae bacterium]